MWVIGAVVIIVLLILAAAAYFFLFSPKKSAEPSAVQTSEAPLSTLAPLPSDTTFPTDSGTPLPSPSDTPSPTPAGVTVEVRNGTHVAGLAQKIKDKLTQENFNVTTIGNAATSTNTKTKVYAVTTADASTADQIAKDLSATTGTTVPKAEAATTADILIILGSDAAKL